MFKIRLDQLRGRYTISIHFFAHLLSVRRKQSFSFSKAIFLGRRRVKGHIICLRGINVICVFYFVRPKKKNTFRRPHQKHAPSTQTLGRFKLILFLIFILVFGRISVRICFGAISILRHRSVAIRSDVPWEGFRKRRNIFLRINQTFSGPFTS